MSFVYWFISFSLYAVILGLLLNLITHNGYNPMIMLGLTNTLIGIWSIGNKWFAIILLPVTTIALAYYLIASTF